MTTAYLAADAARLGDAELPRTVPLRTVTDTVLQELDYAGDLFQKAQEVIDQELTILAAAGVFISPAARRATSDLCQLAANVRLQALLARTGRSA